MKYISNVKCTFPSGKNYTMKDLLNLVKKEGKEQIMHNYSTEVLNKIDKLNDSEFIFNLSLQIENVIVHCFFKKNERTDKEEFIKEITFSKTQLP